MTILTRQELDTRIGADDVLRLASRDAIAGEDAGVVDAAITDAEYEVLGYVRMVTPAPVPDPAPDILKRIVATVARYNLWRRDVPETHPAYITYRDVVKELQAIASGKIALPFGSEQANAASAGAGYAYVPTRVLTDTALAAMLPDART